MAIDPNGYTIEPGTAEHRIGYAYPTSTLAAQLGQGNAGCYYVVDGNANTTTAHATYEGCVAHAATLGTSDAACRAGRGMSPGPGQKCRGASLSGLKPPRMAMARGLQLSWHHTHPQEPEHDYFRQ